MSSAHCKPRRCRMREIRQINRSPLIKLPSWHSYAELHDAMELWSFSKPNLSTAAFNCFRICSTQTDLIPLRIAAVSVSASYPYTGLHRWLAKVIGIVARTVSSLPCGLKTSLWRLPMDGPDFLSLGERCQEPSCRYNNKHNSSIWPGCVCIAFCALLVNFEASEILEAAPDREARLEKSFVVFHIQILYCRQRDFLPFNCDCCRKTFCLEHRTYSAHACSKAHGKSSTTIICPLCARCIKLTHSDDPNAVFDVHTRTVRFLPAPYLKSCRKELTRYAQALIWFIGKAERATLLQSQGSDCAFPCPRWIDDQLHCRNAIQTIMRRSWGSQNAL